MFNSNLCYGCFSENGNLNPCPFCGFDQNSGPESSHHLPPGTILKDKYLVGKVIGQGGFGITYLAWDLVLELKLAIKEFFPMGLVARSAGNIQIETYTGDQRNHFIFGLDRFIGEAKTLARFSEHPNIVTVRDFFKANNTAYVVMNYIEGQTLEEYLKQVGGKITYPKMIDIMMPIMDALREVHSNGFMHRDISPDNIFIRYDGRVILIDFGSARQELKNRSRSLSVILKVGYSPEEQYRSKGEQGPWTDIYAVAAAIYRGITGLVPPESMDRLDVDTLAPPSQVGADITLDQEKILLKALAVKASDRYQTVETFQEAILLNQPEMKDETPTTLAEETDQQFRAQSYKNGNCELIQEESSLNREYLYRQSLKKLCLPASKKKSGLDKNIFSFKGRSGTLKYLGILALCSLLIFGAIEIFVSGEDPSIIDDPLKNQKTKTEDIDLITDNDADYYIDYENGTIPIGDLPIGTRVIDPSWEWEFRTGGRYSGHGPVKSVTWIIVAKNHYNGLSPHVTLLSEEIIGLFTFDDSTNRGRYLRYSDGCNNWGDSGTHNAIHGLRPWLNSTGIHSEEGFYQVFSDNFKQAVLSTDLPNKEWEKGNSYITEDKVFIPSTTELGDLENNLTYTIGEVYPFFHEDSEIKRIAMIGDENKWYWSRTPDSSYHFYLIGVPPSGSFDNISSFLGSANGGYSGVRPVVNLKADVLVVNNTLEFIRTPNKLEENNVSVIDPNDDASITNDNSPSNDIKFFADTGDRPTHSIRNYSDSFPTSTYYVCWDYIYKHPANAEQGYVSITHHYYDSAGNLIDKQAYGYPLRVGATETLLTGGYGQLRDYIYSPGIYHVELYINDYSGYSEKPGPISGSFIVY